MNATAKAAAKSAAKAAAGPVERGIPSGPNHTMPLLRQHQSPDV
jgi:hypothetical protein